MKASSNCIEIIKAFEDFRVSAYPDPASGGAPWTYGYGFTIRPDGKKVQPGDTITREAADLHLPDLVNGIFAPAVSGLLKVAVSQNAFDALVSLGFNIGPGQLATSTIMKLVNMKSSDEWALVQAFLMWNKGTSNGVKKVMGGLVKRRTREAALFFT